MPGIRTATLLAIGTLAAAAGCGSPASWVYRDGEYGVVRVPTGTPRNEAEAVRLARSAYPSGVVLVRVEEVPVGELKIDSMIKRMASIDGGLSAPLDLLNISGLSANRERSVDVQETKTDTEVRYLFRNLQPDLPSATGLAYDPDPSHVIATYLDPLTERRHPPAPTALAQESPAPSKADGEVVKAAK